jgi:parvulin-like peptidyl-prolyl isomerase
MKKSRFSKVTAQILVIGISLAFIVNFGPQAGTACAPQSGPAATADGLTISPGEFNRFYRQRFEQERNQRKDFDEAKAKAEGFAKKIAAELVDSRVLALEGQNRGFRLSDDMMRKMIKFWFRNSMPEEGWDQAVYKRIIQGNYGITTAEWEENLRTEESATQMRSAVMLASMPTLAQVRDRFNIDRTRSRFTTLKIDRSAFAEGAADPSEKELTTWSLETVNAAAIKAQYAEQKGRFDTPKKVQASHVLAKFKAGDVEAEKKAKTKIELAKAKLDGGADFAAVAKEFSDDGSAAKGGDLGMFGPGRMVKAFEEAAFALKAGGTSDVVTSRFGYHIIKVVKIEEASVTSLEDASDELAKELFNKERIGKLAKAHAQLILTTIRTGTSLKTLFAEGDEGDEAREESGYLNARNLKTEDSGWVTAKQRQIKGIGLVPGLAAELLALEKEGACPKVYTTDSGFALCSVEERELPDDEAFADESEMLRSYMGYALRQRLTAALSSSLREERGVKINDNALGANPYR